uniref:26S proteasome non-ATPase regulatory subunit 5 n=1 Tax=Opuntia streptacantha TaxID=393608 RepID=A0A7C9CK81_OPUST
MEEQHSAVDTNQLLQAATDFAYYPGLQNEASVKEFLDRFPLPVIINALQTKAEVPGLENALVACLERIFKTKYGASLIPQYMPFLQVGLQADSGAVKCLACRTVCCLFENLNDGSVPPAQLILAYDIYPPLLDCLVNGDEHLATAAMDAIINLARSPEGIAIIFPAAGDEAIDLRHLATKCSSLGRVRVLALIVKLFSVSQSVASVICRSNLLDLMETEVSKTDDTLATLSTLELLFEMAEVEHASEFLPKTHLLQLLNSIISNSSVESILRSRAMMISGRVLSRESIFTYIDEPRVLEIVSAIERRFASCEVIDDNECESALEAIGQLGSSTHGAELLLLKSPDAARFLVNAAFDRQRRGKQLAALHALGNIAGENRSQNNILLKREAEESLRRLIYETASRTSKLTPSGLLLSVLQQESEIRLAGYRLMSGLVARPWCLVEVCSKQEIINIVTDAYIESTKIGMEARYNCCLSIHQALAQSSNLKNDSALAAISAKVQEAVKRGPYLAQMHREARPAIMTEQRF